MPSSAPQIPAGQLEPSLTVTFTPKTARALLAAEPFPSTDDFDWIEGRDILLNALKEGTDAP